MFFEIAQDAFVAFLDLMANLATRPIVVGHEEILQILKNQQVLVGCPFTWCMMVELTY
jgi:hypothetical protein